MTKRENVIIQSRHFAHEKYGTAGTFAKVMIEPFFRQSYRFDIILAQFKHIVKESVVWTRITVHKATASSFIKFI